jgi:hypothetical protein
VPDHWIRLRGGWEWIDASAPGSTPARLTLPVSWPESIPRNVRLLRHFGKPRGISQADVVLLHIESSQGIIAIDLNGKRLLEGPGTESGWEVPLPSLFDRNELALEVDLARRSTSVSDPARGWGEVALIIRSQGV